MHTFRKKVEKTSSSYQQNSPSSIFPLTIPLRRIKRYVFASSLHMKKGKIVKNDELSFSSEVFYVYFQSLADKWFSPVGTLKLLNQLDYHTQFSSQKFDLVCWGWDWDRFWYTFFVQKNYRIEILRTTKWITNRGVLGENILSVRNSTNGRHFKHFFLKKGIFGSTVFWTHHIWRLVLYLDPRLFVRSFACSLVGSFFGNRY